MHDEVRIAFLARLASRWAKRFTIDGETARAQRFYDLKDRAMRRLAQSPAAEVRHVAGRARHRLDLCEAHQDAYEADLAAIDDHVPLTRWISWNRDEIAGCPDCLSYEAEDGRDLYELRVRFERVSLAFHIPVELGEAFLPPPEYLESVPYGAHGRGPAEPRRFRFGRPLTSEEALKFPADGVEARLAALLGG